MQVSKWLGHSTFTLTLDVCGDYIPEEGGGGRRMDSPTQNQNPKTRAPPPIFFVCGSSCIIFLSAGVLNGLFCWCA